MQSMTRSMRWQRMRPVLSLIHIWHYRTPVIVNSDAHCEADSGNHASAYALLEELDFPQELVVNTSLELLSAYIPRLNAILAQPEGARCGQLPRDTGGTAAAAAAGGTK